MSPRPEVSGQMNSENHAQGKTDMQSATTITTHKASRAGQSLVQGLRNIVLGTLLSAGLFGLNTAAQAVPTVTLAAPGDGFAYNTPVNLGLRATAATDPADIGATLVRVEFYADGVLIGSDTTATTAGYAIAWNNIAVGSHRITARVIDSLGQTTDSAAHTVTITDSTSNLAPKVNLSAPANNAKYAQPATVTLSASATDTEKNGSIAQVDFLANGQIIATVTAKPYTYIWSNPATGTYTLSARATDNLGAVTESAARTITVQTATPPTVNLGGITIGTYVLPTSFNLAASASGGEINTPVTQVEFLANDQVIATVASKPYSYTWTPTVAGTYILSARATDSQGLSATSATRTVTLNDTNTAPTVNLTAPANTAKYVLPVDIAVSANATDLEKNGGITQVDFLANGQLIGTATTKPYSIMWSNPAAGSYTIAARATDNLGGQTVSVQRTVSISDINAPPKVSLISPANRSTYPASTDISLSATANGAEVNTPITLVEFLIDGQVIASATTKPYTAIWPTPAVGTYLLTVRATDSLGAIALSAARTVSIVAVNQPPTVSLTSPTANTVSVAPGSFTLTASAASTTSTITKVDYYASSRDAAGTITNTLIGSATTAPYSFSWSNIPAGSYSLTAVATDALGTSATSAAVNVTSDAPPAVTLTAPATGAPITSPNSFILMASAASTTSTIAKVEFYNGTTLIGIATAAPYLFTWSNVPVGSYSLTAKATDALGTATTSAAINVTAIANVPPTVSLTSPANGATVKVPGSFTLTANAGSTTSAIAKVEFYASSSGVTGTTANVLIGTATTAPYTATWSNVALGSYSITAKATDTLNATTTSTPVTVTVNTGIAQVYYIHADYLDTPRQITDTSGNVVWQYDNSDPFGNNAANQNPNGAGQFVFPLRFAGQYFDSETNTHYNINRDYDPSIGRYVQSDPIGLEGGINTYIYVRGNPISFIDPLGLLDRLVYQNGRLKGYDDFVKEFDVPAVSGPWGKGRLPNGNYNGENLRKRKDNKAMMCPDKSGWSLDLNPAFDTERTDLRIHPDGNVPGTEGCIGPSCGADQKKVYDSLKNYFDQPGNASIPVIVK